MSSFDSELSFSLLFDSNHSPCKGEVAVEAPAPLSPNHRRIVPDVGPSTVLRDEQVLTTSKNRSRVAQHVGAIIEEWRNRGDEISANSHTNDNIDNPTVGIIQYVNFIAVEARLEPSVILTALELLKRALSRGMSDGSGPDYWIDSQNVHRVTATALMIAQKVTTDVPWTNRVWSEITGFSLESLNIFEYELVTLLNFDFGVSPEVVAHWAKALSL